MHQWLVNGIYHLFSKKRRILTQLQIQNTEVVLQKQHLAEIIPGVQKTSNQLHTQYICSSQILLKWLNRHMCTCMQIKWARNLQDKLVQSFKLSTHTQTNAQTEIGECCFSFQGVQGFRANLPTTLEPRKVSLLY